MILSQREYLMRFLKRLEELIPPPANCHHCITYAQFGSDETGWADQLAIQINRDGKFYCLFLDETDLCDDPWQLAASCEAHMLFAHPGNTQIGVSTGQYIGSAVPVQTR